MVKQIVAEMRNIGAKERTGAFEPAKWLLTWEGEIGWDLRVEAYCILSKTRVYHVHHQRNCSL